MEMAEEQSTTPSNDKDKSQHHTMDQVKLTEHSKQTNINKSKFLYCRHNLMLILAIRIFLELSNFLSQKEKEVTRKENILTTKKET